MRTLTRIAPVLGLAGWLAAGGGQPAFAQPRRAEIFGQFGVTKAYDDDGSVGTGISISGAAMLPFSRSWALDLDVQHGRTERNPSPDIRFGVRQVLVSPAIVWRRGSGRAYGFVGGGAGLQIDELFHQRLPGPVFENNSQGPTLLARGGFVYAIRGSLLFRTDFYSIWRFVAPNLGVKAGLGWRF